MSDLLTRENPCVRQDNGLRTYGTGLGKKK